MSMIGYQIDFIGDPDAIRTRDPQIRNVGETFEIIDLTFLNKAFPGDRPGNVSTQHGGT